MDIAHVFKIATVMYPAAWSKEMVDLLKQVRANWEEGNSVDAMSRSLNQNPLKPIESSHCDQSPLN